MNAYDMSHGSNYILLCQNLQNQQSPDEDGVFGAVGAVFGWCFSSDSTTSTGESSLPPLCHNIMMKQTFSLKNCFLFVKCYNVRG